MFEKFRQHCLAKLINVLDYERSSVIVPHDALIWGLWSKKMRLEGNCLRFSTNLVPRAFHRASAERKAPQSWVFESFCVFALSLF